jgi:hypothetical protein
MKNKMQKRNNMSKRLSTKDIRTLKRDGVYNTVKQLDVRVMPHTTLSKAHVLFTAAIHNLEWPSIRFGETFVRLSLGVITFRIAFNADMVEHYRGLVASSVLSEALTQLPKPKRNSKRK